MQINDAGLALIKSFEGCRLQVYTDIAGYKTVGYGHVTNFPVGEAITQDEADQFLINDLACWEERVFNDFPGLNENQFSALVSLCFNVGSGPLIGHLGEYIKANDFASAADQFLVWDHAGGQVVEGLLRRRQAERSLFLLPLS